MASKWAVIGEGRAALNPYGRVKCHNLNVDTKRQSPFTTCTKVLVKLGLLTYLTYKIFPTNKLYKCRGKFSQLNVVNI